MHNLKSSLRSRLVSKTFFSSVLLFSLTLFSCRNTFLLKPKIDKETSPARLQPKALALIDQKDLKTLKKVHVLRIDSSDFRVQALRIGEQLFLMSNTPVVQYEIPQDADYVEILRCSSRRVIDGGEEVLENVELGGESLEKESMVFQRNNFWETATKAKDCELVAGSYSDSTFADVSAPSGEYLYYLRACVDRSRLVGAEDISSQHCSRQVTRSVLHRHSSTRFASDQATLGRAAKLEDRTHTLARQITQKAALLGNTLYSCQEKNKTKVINEQQLENFKILSTGVGAGVGGLAGAGIASYVAKNTIKLKTHHTLLSALAGGVGGSLIGSAVGYMVGSVREAWEDLPNTYPRDKSGGCYSKKEQSLASQILLDKKLEDGEVQSLCSCTDALSLRAEILNMAKELETLQEVIDKVYVAIAPKGEENTQVKASSAGPELTRNLFQVNVKISSPLQVEARDFGKNFKVPTFGLQFAGSDYVQILRCISSYKTLFQSLIQEADSLVGTESRSQSLKWAWYDSFGNPKFCKLAAPRWQTNGVSGESEQVTYFQDITAPSGTFFYIVNPCLAKSTHGATKDECSFILASTDEITFSSPLSDAFLKKAAELTEAELRYDGYTDQLNELTRTLLAQRQSCSQGFQANELSKNQKAGLTDLVTMIGTPLAIGAGAGASYFAYSRKWLSGKTAAAAATAAAAVFSTAAIVSTSLLHLKRDDPASPPSACEEVQLTAERIVKLREDKDFVQAKDKIVSLSQELQALHAEFQGYDKALWNSFFGQ